MCRWKDYWKNLPSFGKGIKIAWFFPRRIQISSNIRESAKTAWNQVERLSFVTEQAQRRKAIFVQIDHKIKHWIRKERSKRTYRSEPR